jgi:hypothetical protein
MSELPSQPEPPRLLYWADLPVSPTVAGATLIHRLFEAWPVEKLMVVTPDAVKGCPLPGVRKCEPPPSRFFARFWNTRFGLHAMSLDTLRQMAAMRLRGGAAPRWLRKSVEEFRPEAVLTVGIAGAWIQAAGLARNLRIPLHMMVHDDHHYAFFWLPRFKSFGERLFGDAYRQSVSRLCVSRPMCEEYARRFGAEGEVLLPSRGRESISFAHPRAGLTEKSTGLNIVYAGSLSRRGFEVLESFAAELARGGHKLTVYTPSEAPPSVKVSALHVHRPLKSAELVRRLHEEADLLLLWTDFDPDIREVVRTLFPSKMTDYTAAAVPILVVAPEDACIVRYLESRPQAASLCTSEKPGDVAGAVGELALDHGRRHSLAAAAAQAGREDFSWESAWKTFSHALARR